MSMTRRTFLRQTLVVGPVVMTLWMETEDAAAQGGAECTLPTGQAQRFVPNEPKVVTRISAAELATKGPQLKQFRDAIGMVRNLPPTDAIS
jgi:hypothetical protein